MWNNIERSLKFQWLLSKIFWHEQNLVRSYNGRIIDSFLVDRKLTVLSFFLHNSFVLKYADSSNHGDFFLHSSLALRICPISPIRTSNQLNARDRKKPSQQE